MRVFVTGATGQLGHDVIFELKKYGETVFGAGTHSMNLENYTQLDIRDRDAVKKTVEDIMPDAIIHCAAWTAVDAAESPENREQVRAINIVGTRNLAEECARKGIRMMYISTDYVFNGEGEDPWCPDSRKFGPLNEYGLSKLKGEFAVTEALRKYYIIRTSWVFGANGKNFVKTMLKVGKTHDKVCVVNDQIGTPTYTADLAKLMADMIHTEKYGFYHATNEGGYISWFEFCQEIYRQSGLKTAVVPVSTAEYGLSAAKRPLNSRLEKSKLQKQGFQRLPDWKDALHRYLIETGEIEK